MSCPCPVGTMPHVDGPTERLASPPGTYGLHVKTVSEVSRAIRERVRADDGLRDLWVEGEVGRVTVSTAGHAYFALKDARAQLQCVWFRDERVRSAFQPQTGLQVIVHGRMDVFEPQGALQLYVDSLQPSGFGNLAIRFEQLKARLSEEGLFDAARKRPLPDRPPRHRRRDLTDGRRLARRLQRARASLAARPGAAGRVPGPGRRRAAEHRGRAAPPGALDRGGGERRPSGRRAGGHDPRPGWGIARGPVVVQRRARRPGDRRAPGAARVRRGPRGRRHAGRLRGRRARADPVGGGGARRARPGRPHRGAPRPAIPARRHRARRPGRGVARGRGGAAAPGSARPGRAPRRVARTRRPAARPCDTRDARPRHDGARSRGAGLGPPARARGRPCGPGARGARRDRCRR